MTKDELRKQCIGAIKRSLTNRISLHEDAEAAFDALHGLVRVVPIEATEEMNQVYWRSSAGKLFDAMAAAGDLTTRINVLIDGSKKDPSLPEVGDAKKCPDPRCPAPIFKLWFGEAGGGYGVYEYCVVCGRIVSKTEEKIDE